MGREGLNNTSHYLYHTWKRMKQRCNNKNCCDYKYYGARGINVCSQWNTSFLNFINDMGDRPEGSSLDRIDNNGPYSKDNCKWSTFKEQTLNQRRKKAIRSRNGTGVYHRKKCPSNPYAVNIKIDGRTRYLGSYRSAQLAQTVYIATFIEWFGEIPNINKSKETKL